MDAIERLLKPRSVAIIGASADADKTSGRPVSYLQKHGYTGRIYPVNPRYEKIGDLRCYADVDALPETPDVALILLGPDRSNQVVAALSRRGTTAAIVLASGYSEVGEAGARRQAELKQAAGSMRILGPNTIGLVNVRDRITLSASGALEIDSLQAGNIAVVSQSGGILGSLLSRAAAAGVGFSALISTSNEVDLDLADFVDYLAGDPGTSVIALYMEGLRNPDKFRAAALRAAAAGKPIVVFKVGRSESGARSAVSHTGALAGSDASYDALFRQIGAIRAERFSDLIDIPILLSTGRRLGGNRVAILTSTGGAGTLVADSLGMAGFETPPPGPATAKLLRDLQNDDQIVMDRNPIDVTLAGLQPALLKQSIATLLASPDYDAVVVVVGSSALAKPTLAADAIAACLGDTDKPVLAYVSPHAPTVLQALNRAGAPAYVTPESMASVLGAMRTRQAWRVPPARPASARKPGASLAGSLNEAQAKALFAEYGIAAPREWSVLSAAEGQKLAASMAAPVVIKVLSARIPHKTEAGGVEVGVRPEHVGVAIDAMSRRVLERTGITPEGFLIQERIMGGTEMILGFHRDPQLGPALLLGMGGVAAEIIKDTTLRLLPIDRPIAEEMVRELKMWPLLQGYRGRPAADMAALVDAILGFAAMAADLDERLLEAEINPLFVLDQGHGVVAADGVAIFA
jgi:acyl-CoA synthetase (NDP forming)